MVDLNYKLANLRDTVKKIKKEIKSFEENESKNIERRTNTLSNKKLVRYSYLKKPLNNKINKSLKKNYFKFSEKEQNLNKDITNNPTINNNINKINSKKILNPKKLHKKTHRVIATGASKQLKKNSYNKIINKNNISNKENNGYNINSFKEKDLPSFDINNNIINENNSCMNTDLLKYIYSKKKEYSNKIKELNKNNEIEDIVIGYSNNDKLKNNIFNNYCNKNKYYKKEILYNDYGKYNITSNGSNIKIIDNSNQFQVQKTNTNKNINISDLLNINHTECNSFNINDSLLKFNNEKLNNKKLQKKIINENKSFNGKIEINPNFIQKNNNLKKFQKKFSNDDTKNDYICNSYRENYIRDVENNSYNNNLLEIQNYSKVKYISTQPSYHNFNLNKEKIFQMNNTNNCITNNNDIKFDIDNKNKEISNKNKILKIIGNNSIGDIYLKAKVFEKCGENSYNYFVNKFCKTKDIINNLKKFKKYLTDVKKEDNHYKKQINIYQRFCKKFFELMNSQEINDIINEVQDNFNNNEEINNYINEQMKYILPY